MSKTVLTRDTISGQVGLVPESYLTHPVLGLNLVLVKADAKDFEPTLHKPTSAAEHADKHPKKAAKPDDKLFELDEKDPES